MQFHPLRHIMDTQTKSTCQVAGITGWSDTCIMTTAEESLHSNVLVCLVVMEIQHTGRETEEGIIPHLLN